MRYARLVIALILLALIGVGGIWFIVNNFDFRRTTTEMLSTTSEKALELHKKAWLEVLNRSETDFYCRYAVYTSRILAVKHPEIYLKSDLVRAQSYPLNITLGTLQRYSVATFKKIYPTGYPIFPFLKATCQQQW